MFLIQYFNFIILKLFETSAIKSITLGIRIKNEWLKKTTFKKSCEKLC